MKKNNQLHLAVIGIIILIILGLIVCFPPKTNALAPEPTEPHLILTPTDYHGQPVPLVIFFHGTSGATDNEKLIVNNELLAPTAQAFRDKGYMVVSSNAHGDNWGDPESQQDYVDLYNYVTSKYKIKKTYFWAVSMGNLDALAITNSRKIPVKAYIGMSPVTNLISVYNNEHLGNSVRTHFNGQPNIKSPIELKNYPKIKYLFYASYQDTYVLRAENIDRLNVPNKKVRTFEGDHNDPVKIDPNKLVSFLK